MPFLKQSDRNRGFTLVEVLGAITLGMLLIAGLGMMLKAGYEGVLSSRFIRDVDSLRSGAETWLTRTQSPNYSNISASQLQGYGIFNGLCVGRVTKRNNPGPNESEYEPCQELAPVGPYDNSYQVTSGRIAFGDEDGRLEAPGNLTWFPANPYEGADRPDPLDLVIVAGPHGGNGTGFIPRYAFEKARNVLKAKYTAIGYQPDQGAVWIVIG